MSTNNYYSNNLNKDNSAIN